MALDDGFKGNLITLGQKPASSSASVTCVPSRKRQTRRRLPSTRCKGLTGIEAFQLAGDVLTLYTLGGEEQEW
jgi:hypothetical protein